MASTIFPGATGCVGLSFASRAGNLQTWLWHPGKGGCSLSWCLREREEGFHPVFSEVLTPRLVRARHLKEGQLLGFQRMSEPVSPGALGYVPILEAAECAGCPFPKGGTVGDTSWDVLPVSGQGS
jgi:hypothetical protein